MVFSSCEKVTALTTWPPANAADCTPLIASQRRIEKSALPVTQCVAALFIFADQTAPCGQRKAAKGDVEGNTKRMAAAMAWRHAAVVGGRTS